MTQDQRGPGYVVHGDAVPENETEEYATEQDRPMTRFQKVASALRGGSERDEHDPAEADGDIQDGRGPQSDPSRSDYWDEPVASGQPAGPGVTRPVDPLASRDEGVAAMDPGVPVDETHPDVPVSATGPAGDDHPATEPDMFGATTRGTSADLDASTAPAVPAVPAVPAAEGQPGAATIADVPAGASDAAAPDAVIPAETAGSTGWPAGTEPADRELRPGEATVALGDFSDLTYGDLVPDAEQFTAKWREIQFRFVDDPHASVTEAADVVAQVTAKMEAAIQERQRAIAERQKAIAEQQRTLRDRWGGEGSNADTENLRATLRMYKAFLDQLIGPKAS